MARQARQLPYLNFQMSSDILTLSQSGVGGRLRSPIGFVLFKYIRDYAPVRDL